MSNVAVDAILNGIPHDFQRASVTVTFDGATGTGAVGTVPILTVTGEVLIDRIVPYVSTDLAATGAAGTATMSFGIVGATTQFVAATAIANLTTGKFWVDTTVDAHGIAVPAACKDIAITDNIIATVINATAAGAQVDTLTIPAKAAATGGDYIVVTAHDGTTFAVALNKAGTDPAPTGAAYVAASQKVNKNISAGTTAVSVATLVNTALNALTGFTAKITSVDVGDGTITLTQVTGGVTAVPVPHNTNDSGAGSITTSPTTPGTDKNHLTSGAIRFDVWYRPLGPDGSIS